MGEAKQGKGRRARLPGGAFFIFALCLVSAVSARAEGPAATLTGQKRWAALESPQEGAVIIAKRPRITVVFSGPDIVPGSLFVTLDSTDITQLVNMSGKGFEYKPPVLLPAGAHTLVICASDSAGNHLQQTLSFSTRHTAPFEEAYSKNNASVVYESTLVKPAAATSVPYSSVDGILTSESRLGNNGLELTLTTRLRYFDQDKPVSFPLKKGLDAQSWTFTTAYAGRRGRLLLSMGDVQVNETRYTVMGLARKGGVLNGEYGDFFLNVYSLQSAQYPSSHGIGISTDQDDHIIGVSGGVRLFNRQVELRTLYLTGGASDSTFGLSTAGGGMKGDVLGFVLGSNLLQNRLVTRFETDFSKFDSDTSSGLGGRNDRAYKFRAGGTLGMYNYDALYEYIGKDY